MNSFVPPFLNPSSQLFFTFCLFIGVQASKLGSLGFQELPKKLDYSRFYLCLTQHLFGNINQFFLNSWGLWATMGNACQSKMVMTNSETAQKGVGASGKVFMEKDRSAFISPPRHTSSSSPALCRGSSGYP